mgnify:CR=1 FL=1
MATMNDTGVYQLANKNWAFRYTITADGRKKDVRKAKDEFGNPLKTKTEAIRARNKALEQEREGKKPTPKARRTVKEVYAEFCENGREDRAYRTKQKQDCLWENHLKGRFGKRFVDEITTAEVNDYLSELYYVEGFSYQYTEAFLKSLDEMGLSTVICTDISRDGAMQGTNRQLYRELSQKYNIQLIASGGVSSIGDVKALKEMNLHGAIIGKAYYTGAIKLEEAIEVAK